MRRLVALPLLALFSISLIGPAVFVTNADSSVPECCRRDGRHRCAMAENGSEPGSGPVLQSDTCPSFPGAHAMAPRPDPGQVGIYQALVGVSAGHAASRARPESLFRISFSRAGQKRGPPISLT
jgi:hypothetical protein